MSLRRRVLIGVIAVAVVMLVTDVVLASTFRTFLLTQVDEQLEQVAGAWNQPFRYGGRPGPGRDGPGAARPGPLSEYYLTTADAQGRLRAAGTPPLGGEDPPQPAPDDVLAAAGNREPFTVGPLGEGGWRLLVRPTRDGDGFVVVGAPLAAAGTTRARLLVVLAWATAAVLATAALVAWWVLRQGVRPLAALAATADAVAQGELSQRVADTDTRTEAGRLGHAFNGMLARIEEAFAQRAATEARLRRFAADASHELRTPLTSIRGYAELYRQGALGDDGALDGAMGRIEAEAARMGGLVDDLLLLARLDQDRPLERTPVRLDELVADAVRDARAVEPGRPITLSAGPATVVGDEARLRQVIGNLLANARVHTPAGTPVEVAVGAQDGWAVVEVADEGPGLDPEQAGRVFERFYRADPARTRASGGTGLGLAIVASVVKAHGGAAEVDSAPGKGARFRLRLPV